MNKTSSYEYYLSEDKYKDTFEYMCKQFTSISPGKRKCRMYCAGTTMGVTRYPTYQQEGVHRPIPRPYSCNKNGTNGHKFLQTFWMQMLIKDVEELSLQFLRSLPEGEQKSHTLRWINKCYGKVPQELRLGDSFFTHMSVTGCMDLDSSVFNVSNAHVDQGDVFTAIINLGFPKEGGNTIFYNLFPEKKHR